MALKSTGADMKEKDDGGQAFLSTFQYPVVQKKTPSNAVFLAIGVEDTSWIILSTSGTQVRNSEIFLFQYATQVNYKPFKGLATPWFHQRVEPLTADLIGVFLYQLTIQRWVFEDLLSDRHSSKTTNSNCLS